MNKKPSIEGPENTRGNRPYSEPDLQPRARVIHQRPRASIETRADRQILDRLISAFDSDESEMDISAVSFFVRSRVVTINGIVGDQADRTRLVDIVRDTSGVDRVIDRLQIAPDRFRFRFLRRSA